MEGIAQKPKPMVSNAANPSQVKEADQKVKRVRERELEDVRFLLTTPQGRSFIWKTLEFCGIFRTSWDGSSNIYFLEGRRSTGLKILADVTEANPEAFVEMMKASKKEEI